MSAEDRPWERGPDGQAITFPNGQHDFLLSALRAIAGPSDSGPFIEVYRAAGGGYEGLQAIARAALAADALRRNQASS